MKYLLFISILLLSQAVYGNELADVQAKLLRHAAKDAVPAGELALAIVELSRVYDQDPLVVTAILLQESRGRAQAFNAKSRDYGLMQINHKTASSMGITAGCLKQWQCNLAQGVRILSQVDRTCRYNVGTRELIGDILQKCLVYEQKLAILD